MTVVVSMPRDRYSPQLGDDLAELLRERFAAGAVELELTLSARQGAVARYELTGRADSSQVDLDQLDRDVAALARSWRDEVALFVRSDRHGICDLFPRSYRDRVPPHLAAEHAAVINEMIDEGGTLALHVDLRPDGLHVAGFHPGGPLILSRFMPLLESVGLTVIEEIPDQLGGSEDLWAQDFLCTPARGGITPAPSMLADAIEACWSNRCEVDSLNQLVTTAGMPWQDVAVLRAYRRYRRQLGTAFTTEYVNEALVDNPVAALALVAVFRHRFDPSHRDQDSTGHDDLVREAVAAIDDVESRDQDRILRDLLELIGATVRTNAFTVRDGVGFWEQPSPTIALKLDGAAIPSAPSPRPWREIFVHGPLLEGTHLRAGPKARGGLRWSDRHDDVRTEILQLMQAQVLKNALIVPTGAKGGFVVKRPTGNVGADVADRYRRFVSALLTVTDNLVAGASVHPADVRCWDDGDPYLVVAADRGTATFSDMANELAAAHDYWLGDAFASGGSVGYDHRGLGITARGAWEIARLHFAEIGIDPETEEISAVGVGDMSGDVFGNGMVRSSTMRLLGAFDHRHVFIDPDPDPAAALEERKRLKDLPGSCWDDWDRAVLSDGGLIVSRSAKRVELTPQVQALLGTAEASLTPPELIRMLLGLNVDLLWFGGIGTWVRADAEENDTVEDRANAECRVSVSQVRARVVVEGGNLAMTRAARWQYAARGGRANLDAIDNAAGVAISDAEVNLKILLAGAVADGTITEEERRQLLVDWTDEVVADVLGRVRRQAWSLGAEVAKGASIRPGVTLIRRSRPDDVDEALPGIDDLDEDIGLSRPQVAVLGSIVRRHLADRMVASAAFDSLLDSERAGRLLPAGARARLSEHVNDHPLRRHMAATSLANDLVNLLGPAATWSLAMVTGPSRRSGDRVPDEVLDRASLALVAALEMLDVHPMLLRIDAERDLLGAERRREAEAVLATTVQALGAVLLRHPITAESVAAGRSVLRTMRAALDDGAIGPESRRTARAATRDLLEDNLVAPDVANLLATAPDLWVAPVLLRLARDAPELDVPAATDVILRTNGALGLDRLEQALDRDLSLEDRWARLQAWGVRTDIE
ncbi:MAG: NAD-glutamate dehydrogenase, partial [Nitriliruptorales bacterium]|nr:NAD-glutamate dehydrogenase [Nitriliruptorales bacterium]